MSEHTCEDVKGRRCSKKEIQELQAFVFLVENYEVTTVEQKILKEYAYVGSMVKVVENINKEFGSENER